MYLVFSLKRFVIIEHVKSGCMNELLSLNFKLWRVCFYGIPSHTLSSTHIYTYNTYNCVSYDWLRQLHTSYMRLNICSQYLWGGTLLLMGYLNKTCVLTYMLFIHSVVCLNIFLLPVWTLFSNKTSMFVFNTLIQLSTEHI